MSYTLGGPIVIPKLVDGRNKLFFFANYSFVADLIPGNIQTGAITIPTEAHLRGDFSDLLLLPNPQQYRIYDPLTARPDPNRPGRIIRDPFPNNIIPQNRIVNPAYRRVHQVPAGAQPEPGAGPGADRQLPRRGRARSDAQPPLGRTRRFQPLASRTASSSAPRAVTSPKKTTTGPTRIRCREGLHSAWRQRKSWSYTGNWTRIFGKGTVLDLQAASNWFLRRRAAPRDEALQADASSGCRSTSTTSARHARAAARCPR